MLRRILLSVQAFSSFDRPQVAGFSLEELQQHSHLTAMIASRMFKGKREAEDAFTGGILHDIGKLILATRPSGGESGPGVRSANPTTNTAAPGEAEPSGVTHAEVGAYLLGIWGLPYAVVEAVAFHHNPLAVRHKTFDVVDAVYVANILAHESASDPSSLERLDRSHLAHLGVEGMLPEWRELVLSLRKSEAAS
jgi:putative nucleotidyltransferase with HDIG domain